MGLQFCALHKHLIPSESDIIQEIDSTVALGTFPLKQPGIERLVNGQNGGKGPHQLSDSHFPRFNLSTCAPMSSTDI